MPEISRLIDSTISKRQGDQRKHSFLEKKILHKRENGFTINTKEYHMTWWIVLWCNRLINFTNIFSYLKMFSMQCRKNITVEDNKKRINIAKFINIYVTRMTQNKNDSVRSYWQKLLCSISYFRISIFDPVSQTVQLEGSYHLLNYKYEGQLTYLSMKISCC